MTLVLLHPLPLDGSVWDDEMRALSPRTLAPTLYDLGDTISEWAEAVLDLAGPGPLVLVGNSVGGSCAVEVAHLAPERVRAVVLGGADRRLARAARALRRLIGGARELCIRVRTVVRHVGDEHCFEPRRQVDPIVGPPEYITVSTIDRVGLESEPVVVDKPITDVTQNR